MFWRKVLVAGLLLVSGGVVAQPYAGVNTFFAYPFDLTKQGFYNTASAGFSVNVGYRPRSGKVYPSGSFSLSYVQQPVYSQLNAISTESVYKNFGISLNYILHNDDKRELIFYGGINAMGISINSVHVASNGNSAELQLVSDGINYLYPGVHAGFRYIGSLKVRNLYWTTDAYVGYIRVFESNNYRLVGDNYYEDVTIKGNVLNPAIMLGIQYVFEKRAKSHF